MISHSPQMMHYALQVGKCHLHHEAPYAAWEMNDPAIRLRQAREGAGYETAKEAAEAMNIPVATYIQHENGTRGFPKDRAARYARFFRTTPEWLLYGRSVASVAPSQLGPQIPVIGTVAAGVWKEAEPYDGIADEYLTGRSDLAVPMKDRFGLKVVGDSMDQIFPDGTLLECVTFWGTAPIENGKFVIVQRRRRDGTAETTVKEYLKDASGIEWLVPRSNNPAFQAPFRCDEPGPDIEEVAIIALVVSYTRYL